MEKDQIFYQQFQDLISMIHFVEEVTSKLCGIQNRTEIFTLVDEEFQRSEKYSMSILMLTEDEKKLCIVKSSVASQKQSVKKGEKLTGLKLREGIIDLKKSSIYRRVVMQDETLQVKVSEIIKELFPLPIAIRVMKLFNYGNNESIITPIKIYEKTVGAFAMSSHELSEYIVPSVKNLVKHISKALELSYEHEERKKLEQLLISNEKKYRALVEDMPVLMCRFKQDGELTFVNEAYCKYFNKKSTDLIGQKFFQFIPKTDRDKVKKHYLSLNRENPLITYEHKVIDREGSIRWQQWTDRVILFSDDRVEEFQSIGIDITKMKEYEEKIYNTKNELERKNIALKELLSQIEAEKQEIKDRISENVEKMILPTVIKIKEKLQSESVLFENIEFLEKTLLDICSPFIKKVVNDFSNLTPRELEICTMVKNGMTNKEIAQTLSVSVATVVKHRQFIRKKLDLTNKAVNLYSYLHNMDT